MAKDFVNPFDAGVNYEEFLKAIPKDSNVEKYCKGKITDEQIKWLVNDLKHYKQK